MCLLPHVFSHRPRLRKEQYLEMNVEVDAVVEASAVMESLQEAS